MKVEKHPVPRSPWLFAACLLLGGMSAVAQQGGPSAVSARAILHNDGTRTESVKDVSKREQKETTYDARGVAISKKIFLLNDNGDPMQGVIYDGADNLIARVQFFFDDLGRVTEERCVNTQGEIFRRVIHQYDSNGRPLPVKAFDYAVNAPNMKVGTINFTKIVPAPDQGSGTAPARPQQPGQTPQIMSVSPRSGTTTTPAEPPKKRGFFGFGKK